MRIELNSNYLRPKELQLAKNSKTIFLGYLNENIDCFRNLMIEFLRKINLINRQHNHRLAIDFLNYLFEFRQHTSIKARKSVVYLKECPSNFQDPIRTRITLTRLSNLLLAFQFKKIIGSPKIQLTDTSILWKFAKIS